MIHQYKVESQERIKKWERERERERERITTFSRENNKKIVENNVRRKKSKNKKYSNKYQIIQVILCYVIK